MKHFAYLGSLRGSGYDELIREGLEYIQFNTLVGSGSRVFIKPNLTFPSYRPGVMTSPEAVEAAIVAIRDYTPHVYIGDADSGGYNPFSMDGVYGKTGLRDLATRYGVHVVNLSKIERKQIEFQYRRRKFTLDLPRLLTDEIDLLVTMPVPKVHCNTGVSLTFKNQWGCIPEPNDRLKLHPFLEHVLLEVNKAVKGKVVIMDGRYGLNGNGPMRGSPVKLEWVLVANDLGVGARVACELMQIPIKKIRHLRYLKEQGLIPELHEISINRDLVHFQKDKFELRRDWADYPGLLAFRSPFIAYLAYFSPLAGVSHRILYLFREPFYDYEKYSQKK